MSVKVEQNLMELFIEKKVTEWLFIDILTDIKRKK